MNANTQPQAIHPPEGTQPEVGQAELVAALSKQSAYPKDGCTQVELHETHISRVFLTDQHAYKTKRPVRNEFIDYSTLSKRRHFCDEELRLDRRYAPELYLDVVPITQNGATIEVQGSGMAVEYAVKMRRFLQHDLLSHRLAQGTVSALDIQNIAQALAGFHALAARAEPTSSFGAADRVQRDALDNLNALADLAMPPSMSRQLAHLRDWTAHMSRNLGTQFEQRKLNGYVRECHGDLHAGNILWWRDRWTPFDGIEFNESFRWIDVLSDAGFLAMDLVARKHSDLAHLFVNSYFEGSGDYAGLPLLKWYMVYRGLVRAKVDRIRMLQLAADPVQRAKTAADLEHQLETACSFTRDTPLRLWITHGLSGSGKSSGALRYVLEEGAIRIRSDVERKRLLGMQATDRPDAGESKWVYSDELTQRTYCRLRELACATLSAGYSVVVDATFLRKEYRDAFVELAHDRGAAFQILDFQLPESELRARIDARQRDGTDPSDASNTALDSQIQHQEPLTRGEQRCAIRVANA